MGVYSNTSRPGKYGHGFVDNISKCISPMMLLYFVSDLAAISTVYQHPTCGSDISVAPNRCHAIIWNKDGPFDRCMCTTFGLN